MTKNDHLDYVFHPRSIAVIGASSDPMKFGGRAYLSIRSRKGQEKLYGVNPNAAEIDGEKAYSRIQDIKDNIDFAVITVPAAFVVQAVKDCAEKKVRALEILSAGFTEADTKEGAELEQQVTNIARQHHMRVVGPNCFGVYSPDSPLTILPGVDYPKEMGPLGVFAQSGGFTSNFCRRVLDLGLRISKAVSYGNACDLNEMDFLSYFKNDVQTKVIAAYIEGIRDGRRFLDIVREISFEKPVIIWKGGLTRLGSRAVASHTASMGGSNEIWQAFYSQTGAIQAVGIDEMVDLIVGFHCMPTFSAKRFSVIGGGGAITVAASDALEKEGLSIVPFSQKTVKAIRAHLPPHGNSAKNPVDMGTPRFMVQTFAPILQTVTESDQVDAVIIEQMAFDMGGSIDEKLAEAIASNYRDRGKPVILTLPQTSTGSKGIDSEISRRKYRAYYLSNGIPVFDSLERAVRALGKIIRYNRYKKRNRS